MAQPQCWAGGRLRASADFSQRLPEIAAMQVLILIRQGRVAAAAQLARQYELPRSQARVLIAHNDPSAALAVLEPLRQQMEARGWADERLKTIVLQAVARHLAGEQEKAAQGLGEALALARPGGFIRLFVDEGAPMAQLLLNAASQGVMPDYVGKLLAVLEAEKRWSADRPDPPPVSHAQPLIEPLSQRELEILNLIAQGLANREISARLFLALDTVKGHNRRIFDKLQVQSRTEAIARAGSWACCSKAKIPHYSPLNGKNNTTSNTEVSIRQYRPGLMLFLC